MIMDRYIQHNLLYNKNPLNAVKLLSSEFRVLSIDGSITVRIHEALVICFSFGSSEKYYST